MTTKPPSPVIPHPQDALERIAYDVVADIPAQEPNDVNRLGYNVWIWLKDRKGTLEQAVHAAGSRTHIPFEDVVSKIRARLQERGISLPG